MTCEISRHRCSIKQHLLRKERAAVYLRLPCSSFHAGCQFISKIFRRAPTAKTEWQLVELLLRNAGSDIGSFGLEQAGFTGDIDGFTRCTYFELSINAQRLSNTER